MFSHNIIDLSLLAIIYIKASFIAVTLSELCSVLFMYYEELQFV